jgi:prepilin peptidase CpaA
MSVSNTLNSTVAICLMIILVTAVITDIKSHRIPNVLLFPALAFSLMFHTATGGADGLLGSLAGLALGIAMLLPLYVMGGMGAGDVKLLGVVGSFLGPWATVVAGMATMIAGAVVGITVILWRRLGPTIPIHKFPPAGAQVVTSSGSVQRVRPEPRSIQIAYAPAIAAGTVAALWYVDMLPVDGIT